MPFDGVIQPTNPDTTKSPMRECADRVVDLIKGGWCQGVHARTHPDSGKPSYCVIGAIQEVTELDFDNRNFNIYREICINLSAFLIDNCYVGNKCGRFAKIITWNDDPRRTHGEVVSVLEEWAKTL